LVVLEKAVERHDEQLERLEDLVRELVLTAESLRREIAPRGAPPPAQPEQKSRERGWAG
jgi:hypothetical protein